MSGVKEYTEHLVRCRQLLTKIEDEMLNDRDVHGARQTARALLVEAAEMFGTLRPIGSLAQPYWTARQVDADTTVPPLGEH